MLWTIWNYYGPYKKEIGVSEAEKGDVMKEEKIEEMYSDNWGTGHNPNNAGGLWKLQTARKRILLWSLQK